MSEQTNSFGWSELEKWHERLPKMLAKADAVGTMEAQLAAGVFYAFQETTRLALAARKDADAWKREANIRQAYESVLDQIWAALHPGGGPSWSYAGQVLAELEKFTREVREALAALHDNLQSSAFQHMEGCAALDGGACDCGFDADIEKARAVFLRYRLIRKDGPK